VPRRWIALLAAGATASAFVAATVPALAQPGPAAAATYEISLTGSQRTVVTRSGTTTDASGCAVRHADRDVQTITFASSRRARFTLGAKALPTLRFALAARVAGSSHRESGSDCAAPKTSDSSCGPATVHADLATRATRNLGTRLAGRFARSRDRTRCSTTLEAPDRFLQPSESHLTRSPARAGRVFLHGHLVLRTVEGSKTKITVVDWRLTLRRV
jgi:hypothetical protein